jgi:hypothetical protein
MTDAAYMREWRAKNPQRDASTAKRSLDKLRKGVLDQMGGKCVRCGFADYRALQIDHIEGGGLKELRERWGGNPHTLYRYIRDHGSGGYQLLCANCNWIKRAENREHA